MGDAWRARLCASPMALCVMPRVAGQWLTFLKHEVAAWYNTLCWVLFLTGVARGQH